MFLFYHRYGNLGHVYCMAAQHEVRGPQTKDIVKGELSVVGSVADICHYAQRPSKKYEVCCSGDVKWKSRRLSHPVLLRN